MAYDPLTINFAKTDAIILRTYEYSETSYVLSLLTRAHGRLHALAKGARRPKGIFGGEIDLLAEGQAVLVMHPDTSLHLLTEFSNRKPRLALRDTLPRSYAACYAAELAGAASPEGDAQPQLYDLLCQTLDSLETGDPAAITAFFQVHLLALTGFMPDLVNCAACGKRVTGPRVVYSFAALGVLCEACAKVEEDAETRRHGDAGREEDAGTRGRGDAGKEGRGRRQQGSRHHYRVSRATISLVSSLARGGRAALSRTKVPRPLAIQTISFLGHALAAAFEHDPHSLRPLLERIRGKL